MARKKSSARKKVKPINLDSAIAEVLKEYGEEVYEVLDESIDEVADEAVEKLKAVNHFAAGGNPSGEYSASWVNEKVNTSRIKKKDVVHNEEHYRLTHLLEKGHVIRNGRSRITGKDYGKTGAYPHIAPVNDWANKELPMVIERKLR